MKTLLSAKLIAKIMLATLALSSKGSTPAFSCWDERSTIGVCGSEQECLKRFTKRPGFAGCF